MARKSSRKSTNPPKRKAASSRGAKKSVKSAKPQAARKSAKPAVKKKVKKAAKVSKSARSSKPAKPVSKAKVAKAARPKPVKSPRRSGSGLTPRDIDMFRGMLLQKRAEISGDVASLSQDAAGQDSGNLSSVPQHMADLGSDNYEQEFALRLMADEQALLVEIDDALNRIKEGTYGICMATGAPIGKRRLLATPWAKYSYEYVLEQEQRGRVV